MREEHPIDERFSALYDAGSTPPESVRNALAVRFGWATETVAPPFWRPYLIAAIGLFLVGGAVAYWLYDAAPERPTARVENHSASGHDGNAPAALATDPGPRPHDSGSGNSSIEQGNTAAVATHPQGPAAVALAHDVLDEMAVVPGHIALVQPERANSMAGGVFDGATGDTTPRNTSISSQKEPEVPAADRPSTITPELGTNALMERNTHSATLNSARAEFMLPQRITTGSTLTPGLPSARQAPLYVLPAGSWWIGTYAAVGTVSGTWKGPQTADLNTAEQWRSSVQAGALFGRTWRSGWSVSLGIGGAQMRSVFMHDDTGEDEPVLEVDTNWTATPYPDAQYTLYTWSIDSVIDLRPGTVQRRDARNSYQAIQVPVTVSWHGTARRFHYGALGGLSVWIPTYRKGLSLVQPTLDGSTRVSDLNDDRLDARFTPQIHGRAGVGLGYSICEALQFHVEPMVSVPVATFNDNATPWPIQTFLQFRLQYELRTTSR